MNKAFLLYIIKVYPCYIVLSLFAKHPRFFQNYLYKKFIAYIRKNNNYYCKVLSSETEMDGINLIENIPLLDKETIRKNIKDITSKTVNPNIVEWANTGGSTGEPLKFPRQVSKIPYEDIHQVYIYKQMGWVYSDVIISIDGTRVEEKELSQNHYWKKGNNFPYGKYSLSTMYMSKTTLPYYIEFLNITKPSILRGYPSGIKTICTFLREHSITLDFKIKGVYLTSEFASEEDKYFISKTLHCNVWGQYGHTEVSVFAICKPNEEKYLCSPFYGITEVLDNEGNHVKVGEQGEIVVTGFSNLGLPFLRYKTGDLAIYGGIENGWVILTKLLGRSVDYIINKDNEHIYLTGFIFGGHLHAFNAIADWQIRQDIKGQVTITIVKTNDWKNEYENDLFELFSDKAIDASILYAEKIERSRRGKRIFMIQNIK